MKNLMNKINMAIICAMVSAPAMAANYANALCPLIEQMGDIFSLLRTLAFVGAAFTIAGWAWGYIKGGKAVDVDDVRNKGTGMLVGFIMLFGIGVILQAIMAMAGDGGPLGCNLQNW